MKKRLLIAMAFIGLNITLIAVVLGQTRSIWSLKDQKNRFEAQETLLTSAGQIYGQYGKEIDELTKVFPNEESVLNFLEDLEVGIRLITKDYTVKFSSVSPIEEQGRLFVPLAVTLKTDHAGLLQFFDQLEHLPYITHVTTILGKTPSGFDSTGEILITIKLYVQNPFTVQ